MAINPENRKKFERRGLALVQQHLQMGITDDRENIDAQSWITEQDRKRLRQESVRYWLLLAFTVTAAVGGTISAWPIVKDWMASGLGEK